MKISTPKSVFIIAALAMAATLHAEDGSALWLRYKAVNRAKVSLSKETPTTNIAQRELTTFYDADRAVLLLVDNPQLGDEGFVLKGDTVEATAEAGLLYGAYALLERQRQTATGAANLRHNELVQVPAYGLRLLNHWDNLDGSIERGYAGQSIFWRNGRGKTSRTDLQRIGDYARANASIGINGAVLNNVNASPQMLTRQVLSDVKTFADILRPYHIRVFLSINFATPMALGQTATADPLDPAVRAWWAKKAKEIYKMIPDFGGFLVKANSEGQPGPGDFGRSHADGANMLAEALAPHGGIVMWRCFVYGANHKGEDRVKQAVSEFEPLDGQFRDNVILQTKNGPLDFQPREPYSPIFDRIVKTPNMAELQITQEYTGQSKHLVYLAPMWKEFFHQIDHRKLRGVAGVANVGDDANWCGHHFSQANWYAFGRMAWNPDLDDCELACQWLRLTFDGDSGFMATMSRVMTESREACVNYMMPLGLHHLFRFDHHYGPEPDGFRAEYPIEWCPVYYHKADSAGVGFDRSSRGTGATLQYREEWARRFDSVDTCPEALLLWFHHVPWTRVMHSGLTLWEEMQDKYESGVRWTERTRRIWRNMRPQVDQRRWQEVADRLDLQADNAREWRDACLGYFRQFAEQK